MSKLLLKLLTGYFFRFGVVGDEGGGGATHEETGEVVGSGNDSRLKLYNEIADGLDRFRSEELAHVNDDGSTEEFSLEEVEEEASQLGEEPDTPEEESSSNEPESFQSEVPPRYRIKVNGVEQELSLDELIARAQKVEAADQYLNEASRLYKEAKSHNQPANQSADNSKVEEDDLALARAIQMGSEEEAVNAIRKLKSNGLSKDDLTRQIDERMIFQEANRFFATEYKDIVSNPRLYEMAIRRDAELIQSGDTRSFKDRYDAIGKEIRGWVKEISGNVSSSTLSQEQKKERKEAAPTAPKSVALKAQQEVEEESEPTTQEIIQGIAKSRGGPQWMRG